MINVAVNDIDSHYEHALAEGATITMPIEDTFYGYRRYEADDLEGHHWHFQESTAPPQGRLGSRDRPFAGPRSRPHLARCDR